MESVYCAVQTGSLNIIQIRLDFKGLIIHILVTLNAKYSILHQAR